MFSSFLMALLKLNKTTWNALFSIYLGSSRTKQEGDVEKTVDGTEERGYFLQGMAILGDYFNG
jgi:hypothetical protein